MSVHDAAGPRGNLFEDDAAPRSPSELQGMLEDCWERQGAHSSSLAAKPMRQLAGGAQPSGPFQKGEFGLFGNSWERVPIDAQSVDAPLSQAAIFLVVSVADGQNALVKVCSVLGGLDDLVKTVGFRDLSGRLSCIAGIGSQLWDRLRPGNRPRELKPFMPIVGKAHSAPSTPGDLLFHIRAERPDPLLRVRAHSARQPRHNGDGCRRSFRLPIFRCARPARLRGRNGQSRRSRSACLGARRRMKMPNLRAAAMSSSRNICTILIVGARSNAFAGRNHRSHENRQYRN